MERSKRGKRRERALHGVLWETESSHSKSAVREMTSEVQFVTDHSATEDQDIGDQKQRASQALFPTRRMVANDRSAPTQKGTSVKFTL